MNYKTKKIFNYTCIKMMLFLFLGLLISENTKAQCPPSSSLITTNASAFGVNDAQAIIQVTDGVGPFTYYWENLSNSSPASGPTTPGMALSDTFANALSGTYTVSVIDAGCPSSFLIDTLTITGFGGSISYSGSLALCGVTTANLTAYFAGCSSSTTILGTQFILSDGLSTLLDSTVLADSINLPTLGKCITHLGFP